MLTVTSDLDLDMLKMTQYAKYLGQRLFRLKVIVHTYRDTHRRPIALLGH